MNKPELISEWRQVWKYYSTHAMVIYTGGLAFCVDHADYIKDNIPKPVQFIVLGLALITFILARIVKQENVNVVDNQLTEPTAESSIREETDGH